MPLDHIVPRFLIARWADADTQKIAVADLQETELREEDPQQFYRLRDFNTITDSSGRPQHWLEQELLAGLDDRAARSLRRLEHLPKPHSHLRAAKKSGWHFNHVTSPRATAGLAMFVAAQAVRSPVWRQTVNENTAASMKRHVEQRVEEELNEAVEPIRRAELQQLIGLRYVADVSGAVNLPLISGHLAYRRRDSLLGLSVVRSALLGTGLAARGRSRAHHEQGRSETIRFLLAGRDCKRTSALGLLAVRRVRHPSS